MLPTSTATVATAQASATPAATEPLGPTTPGRIENFELVGRQDLGQRGWNAGLALAYPCAYLAGRPLAQIAIIDVSDPTDPRHAGDLSLAPGTRPVELRAVADLGLLVVLNFSPDLSLITFDVSDCLHPRALGTLGLGLTPHELYLWRDPQQPARLLLYAATWSHQTPDLLVVDLSQPSEPRLAASWTAADEGAAGTLHSLSLSRDGRLAYLALTEGGFLLADASDFALGRPDPHLRLLRDAAGGFAPTPGLGVHSAVPLDDPRYALVTEEIYPCPFAGLFIADVQAPARPISIGRFGLPENDGPCPPTAAPDAVFTAHNPLVVGNLAFVTWYGGGLQALDVEEPTQPRRVGLYVPDGEGAAARSYIGAYPVQMWSYPVLRAGLLYVADIQSGLHILRYTGPGAERVNAVPLAEGNVSVLP